MERRFIKIIVFFGFTVVGLLLLVLVFYLKMWRDEQRVKDLEKSQIINVKKTYTGSIVSVIESDASEESID